MIPPPRVGFLNLGKKVIRVVRFTEIVLYVVIFRGDAQLDELPLEGAGLLKKAMYFSFDFHYLPVLLVCFLAGFVAFGLGVFNQGGVKGCNGYSVEFFCTSQDRPADNHSYLHP